MGFSPRKAAISLYAVSYTHLSPLAVQFIDKFGVQWGFMVDENE